MAAEYAHIPCYASIMAHLSKYNRMIRNAPDSHSAIKILKKLHCPAKLLNFMISIGIIIEFRTMHRGIKAIRQKYLLQPRQNYLDELEREYNLVTDIEDFSPMKNLPGNYTYVGPVYHVHSQNEDELLSKLDPNKKTIFISLGTFWSSDNLFALFNDPIFRKYNIVIAGKPGIQLAPEILHKPFVNLESILSKADLLICHGGDATVYQGLSHAVPLLGFAFHGEQTWSLQRVTSLCFGETINLPMTANQLQTKVQFWIKKREEEEARFKTFAQKISLTATKQRFRESLLHLNERTLCKFCHQGTLANSQEIVNVPSDTRIYRNFFFRVWRCNICHSIHSVRILDMSKYYENYPYDKIQNNIFVEGAFRNLVKIVKSYGAHTKSSILYSGAITQAAHDIFRKCRLTNFEILQRPTSLKQQWIFPQKEYDMIILIDSLERIVDHADFFKNITTCLKPGGRMVIFSPDAARINLNHVNDHIHDLHQPYRLYIISVPVLLRIARSAGLELIEYHCQHFWDTLYPFINHRLIHALKKITDGSLDATIPLPKFSLNRWWNFPEVLWAGFFGGIFKKNSTMLTIFERPKT